MGAVCCAEHGTQVSGPLACEHIAGAMLGDSHVTSYAVVKVDVADNQDFLVDHAVCEACLATFGIDAAVLVAGDVWEDKKAFPNVTPICPLCFERWSLANQRA